MEYYDSLRGSDYRGWDRAKVLPRTASNRPADNHVRFGFGPGSKNIRTVNSGDASRVAFPGQPGYNSRADTPVGVPGTGKGGWDLQATKLRGGPNPYDISSSAHYYQPGEEQSWNTVMEERAYNSPRFLEAMSDQLEADPESWKEVNRLSRGSAGDYAAANMARAKVYWKAHVDVMSGKYDHIEDPFEDTVRTRDPKPQYDESPLAKRVKILSSKPLIDITPRVWRDS